MKYADKYVGGFTPAQKTKVEERAGRDLRKEVASGRSSGAERGSGERVG